MITLPVWKCILPVMRKIRENTGKISGGQMSFTKLPWLCPRLFIDFCLLWTKSFRRNAGHWFPNCYFYYLLWWYNWVECFWVLHQLFPQAAGPWFKPSILPLTRFVPSVHSWISRIVYWFYHCWQSNHSQNFLYCRKGKPSVDVKIFHCSLSIRGANWIESKER